MLAQQMYNFVTRDGTPPEEFREVGRRQLVEYPNVEVRDIAVTSVKGERGAFALELGAELITAKRVLVCTGLIDVLPDLPGFEAGSCCSSPSCAQAIPGAVRD